MRRIFGAAGMAIPLGVGLLMGEGACVPPPLSPAPGARQYQAPAFVALPVGRLDVAGGNLLLRRTDLSIDTRIGPQAVGAAYNSATGAWLWSFEVRYDGQTFVDESGALHAVAALADGAPIPGTVFTRLDATRIATRGGLVYAFDAATHRLLRIQRRGGEVPQLRFVQGQDAAGAWRTERVEQCGAAGCSLVYAIGYVGAGAASRVASIADRAGRRASFAWDASGRLASARDPLDVARGSAGFRYEYQESLLVAVTSSEGVRTEIGYEEGGGRRLVRMTQIGVGDPTWRVTYYGPDASGVYRTDLVDPLGGTTLFRYDAQARVASIRNAAQETTSIEWSGLRPIRVVSPDGAATSLAWSGDALAAAIPPWGGAIGISYQAGGENRADPLSPPLLRAWDALGVIRENGYDAQGRIVSLANGAGETTRIGYGADGEVESVTDPAGIATRFMSYGEHGHAESVERGGLSVAFEYDDVGNLVRGPDLAREDGGIVARGYDEDRNLASLELAELAGLIAQASQTLRVEWRSDGHPSRILRPGGGDTELAYDALGRLVARSERADGAWRWTSYAHDALGRTTAIARANGMAQTWSYDAAGRVVSQRTLRSGSLESVATWTWRDGRPTALDDSSRGGVERYTYDAAGRLGEVRYGGGERIALGYDPRSRLATVQLWTADGALLRMLGLGYDAQGRESSVSLGLSLLVARSFASGRLEAIRYGNGLSRSFRYDAARGLLVGTALAGSDGAELETTSLDSADPNCVLAQRCVSASTESALGASFEKYWLGPAESGPLGRAGKRVAAEWGGGIVPAFGYDALSNLVQTAAAALHYNAERNRLLEIESGPTYAWDAAGFATRRGDVALGWDGAGRIAAAGDARFAWDALGRPVSRASGGAETRLLFGGLVEADGAGRPLAIELGEVRVDLVGGGTRYRHFDFRGNPQLVSDAAGRLVAHSAYGAYGLEELRGSSSDPLRFAGGREVGELVLIGRRLYDPAAARFLAPDPIPQLVNQYAYALGNPVLRSDPSGADSVAVDLATGAAGFAGGRIGQAVGTAAGAEWGGVIGALIGGPPGGAAGAAVGGFVGGAVGGAYGGAASANMAHEAMTGEQLFSLQILPPDGGAGPRSSGTPMGGGSQMSAGGAVDADRGDPIPPTHPCGGDACAGPSAVPALHAFGGFAGSGCAPVALGRLGDLRLAGALVVANCALGLAIRRARGRRRA